MPATKDFVIDWTDNEGGRHYRRAPSKAIACYLADQLYDDGASDVMVRTGESTDQSPGRLVYSCEEPA